MKFRVEVVCLNDGGKSNGSVVLEMERRELAMETLGMSLCESKAMLQGVQDFVAAQQTAEDLEQRARLPELRPAVYRKDGGTIGVKTVFGTVEVPIRGGSVARARPSGRKTFRPAAAWLQGHDQSGVALSGDQVGLADSVRESGGFVERSAAGRGR